MSLASAQEYIRSRIADFCVEIEDLFKKNVPRYVTVIVRPPNLPEQEVVVTNDPDAEAIITTLQRRFELPMLAAADPALRTLSQHWRAKADAERFGDSRTRGTLSEAEANRIQGRADARTECAADLDRVCPSIETGPKGQDG